MRESLGVVVVVEVEVEVEVSGTKSSISFGKNRSAMALRNWVVIVLQVDDDAFV